MEKIKASIPRSSFCFLGISKRRWRRDIALQRFNSRLVQFCMRNMDDMINGVAYRATPKMLKEFLLTRLREPYHASVGRVRSENDLVLFGRIR